MHLTSMYLSTPPFLQFYYRYLELVTRVAFGWFPISVCVRVYVPLFSHSVPFMDALLMQFISVSYVSDFILPRSFHSYLPPWCSGLRVGLAFRRPEFEAATVAMALRGATH